MKLKWGPKREARRSSFGGVAASGAGTARGTTAPRTLRWLPLSANPTHGGSGRDDARCVRRAGRSGRRVRKSAEAGCGCRRRGVVRWQRAIEGGEESATGRHGAVRRAATGGGDGGGGAGRGRRRGPGGRGGARQPVRSRGESTTPLPSAESIVVSGLGPGVTVRPATRRLCAIYISHCKPYTCCEQAATSIPIGVTPPYSGAWQTLLATS